MPTNDITTLSDFLGAELATRIYEFAVSSENDFVPAKVGKDEGKLDEIGRRSSRLVELGEFSADIESGVERALPQIIAKLGIGPFEVGMYEIELVSHGDGCFYKRHLDTFTGGDRNRTGDRIVSCVYYFHSPARAYSGGALRIYPLPTAFRKTPDFIDVVPEHDTLAAFSSWLPHEVMPVHCPSKLFEHSRFSINCWVYRATPVAASVSEIPPVA